MAETSSTSGADLDMLLRAVSESKLCEATSDDFFESCLPWLKEEVDGTLATVTERPASLPWLFPPEMSSSSLSSLFVDYNWLLAGPDILCSNDKDSNDQYNHTATFCDGQLQNNASQNPAGIPSEGALIGAAGLATESRPQHFLMDTNLQPCCSTLGRMKVECPPPAASLAPFSLYSTEIHANALHKSSLTCDFEPEPPYSNDPESLPNRSHFGILLDETVQQGGPHIDSISACLEQPDPDTLITIASGQPAATPVAYPTTLTLNPSTLTLNPSTFAALPVVQHQQGNLYSSLFQVPGILSQPGNPFPSPFQLPALPNQGMKMPPTTQTFTSCADLHELGRHLPEERHIQKSHNDKPAQIDLEDLGNPTGLMRSGGDAAAMAGNSSKAFNQQQTSGPLSLQALENDVALVPPAVQPQPAAQLSRPRHEQSSATGSEGLHTGGGASAQQPLECQKNEEIRLSRRGQSSSGQHVPRGEVPRRSSKQRPAASTVLEGPAATGELRPPPGTVLKNEGSSGLGGAAAKEKDEVKALNAVPASHSKRKDRPHHSKNENHETTEEIARLQRHLKAQMKLANALKEENHVLLQRERLLQLQVDNVQITMQCEADQGVKSFLQELLQCFRSSLAQARMSSGKSGAELKEDLRDFTLSDFRNIWGQLAQELSLWVPMFTKSDEDSTPVAVRSRMSLVYDRLMTWIVNIAVKKPGLLTQAAATDLSTGEPSKVTSGFWITIVQSLQFSDQQVEDLTEVWRLYSQVLVGLASQQTKVQIKLTKVLQDGWMDAGQACTTGIRWETGCPDGYWDPEDVIKEYLTVHRRYNVLDHMLHFLVARLLTPSQICAAIVLSYPMYPSMVEIAKTVVEVEAPKRNKCR
ncbi:hypothetical protein CEUSTIGMA_g4644.t1 [Chlamydomonas eustigma]|uniref:Uncharacterized protein n=1 Tax=Chlamydomonas eustigma TaxID=1157962 RepID=A0A250X2A2_9CHLO|nr:hypothetical protein CEUSTIGMA_g4644.t1 [Chlamydomonas eustigma]|eukprot:GAX77198.1 hypothetical protein CEUSTIGMA_g4644.t1 [Chlamydomonas eustigma]